MRTKTNHSYRKSRCYVLFSRCILTSTVDLTVTLYQVQARVRESQYGDDVYMVKVVKPEGIGDLIDEEGTLMEHGKFSFDLTEEIAIDTELEIEITGVGSSTGIS